MSKVATLLDIVEARLRASGAVTSVFRDITQKEFPYCDNSPALHVNAADANDEIGQPAMGYNTRVVQVRVYVTFSKKELELLDKTLWIHIDMVRSVLVGDGTISRYWEDGGGNRLAYLPTLIFDVRTVPSPLGTPYVGTRVIQFDVQMKEAYYGT
jgi:hypothetical protein